MAGTLNTSVFLRFQGKFQQRCFVLFNEAFNSSILNKCISLDFDENDITAILHNFIDKNPKRKGWEIVTNLENYIFDKNVVYAKGFASKFSRIDMRYTAFWQGEEFKYFVEAKNLKTTDSALKRRYIETGIDNFLINGKYYFCDGFLVGYVLEGSVSDCLCGVNKLLMKDKRDSEQIYYLEANVFQSNHFERKLKHLFFDFVTTH